jgi:radical SAM superfamily enzyme YgiQ (UPF0313 family)
MNLAYIASACRDAGHQVTIYNQDIYHYPDAHLTKYLDENQFDAVGMGACGGYYQYRKIKQLCEAVNASRDKPHLILGGHLVSPDPEFFLRSFGCHYICVGEGEITIIELLDALSGNRALKDVKGLAYMDKYGGGVHIYRKQVTY